nr:hypothetical protein [bacterium]
MACKYHPNAAIAGKCVECGNEFCRECGVQFTHGTKCLDCAAEYANKKIGQSYIAAGIGFVFGLIGVSQGGWMILAPILMAYVFFSTFWGWQYGGRLWPWLARLTDKIEGEDWQNVAIFFLLTIRFAFSYLVGIFGGGIAGFLWCRGIVAKQLSMEMQRPMSPEMQRPMSEIFAPEEYEWEQGEEEGDEEFEGV